MSEIKVGKYTLESLTTGMYNDPKITYREYIQNAVDSLEEAVRINYITKEEMRIEIIINEEDDRIAICDNGVGIQSSRVFEVLTNIGSSKKRYSSNRGFRGIGRLGGLSYCQKLRFITSAKGENVKSIVEYDCKKLKTLLVPGAYENYDLSKVMNEVTSFETETEENEKHYFIVEMIGVDSFSSLLDEEKIKSYIRQVAPVAYKKRFIWKSEIKRIFEENNLKLDEFPIYVGVDKQSLECIFKPNNDKFHSNKRQNQNDEIKRIEKFTIEDDDKNILAVGWYGICDFYGMIADKEISGLRVRKGNILIGDDKLLNVIFKEDRFNSWIQGEVFITYDNIIPNARRDDFEQNESYFRLVEELKLKVGEPISSLIRNASKTRNNQFEKTVTEAKKVIEEVKKVENKGFNSKVEKDRYIDRLDKTKVIVEKVKPKDEQESEKKKKAIEEIEITIDKAISEVGYKTDNIKSIGKKERKILHVITDIISEYLDKDVVDEIIDRIDKKLSTGGK